MEKKKNSVIRFGVDGCVCRWWLDSGRTSRVITFIWFYDERGIVESTRPGAYNSRVEHGYSLNIGCYVSTVARKVTCKDYFLKSSLIESELENPFEDATGLFLIKVKPSFFAETCEYALCVPVSECERKQERDGTSVRVAYKWHIFEGYTWYQESKLKAANDELREWWDGNKERLDPLCNDETVEKALAEYMAFRDKRRGLGERALAMPDGAILAEHEGRRLSLENFDARINHEKITLEDYPADMRESAGYRERELMDSPDSFTYINDDGRHRFFNLKRYESDGTYKTASFDLIQRHWVA